MKSNTNTSDANRRKFIKNSTLIAGTLLTTPLAVSSSAYVAGSDVIKVALIGCGGRGTGAASQVLTTHPSTKLVAMVDAFKSRLDDSYKALLEKHGSDKVDVSNDHKFVGLSGYKDAIPLADLVLLTTPPGFRPDHMEEAVRQGKNIFMEKPVATDVPGIKKVLALAKEAEKKNLKILVGHHLRYQNSIIESVNRIQNGDIGDIIAMNCYFNSAGVWVRHRQPEMNELQYQVWNWYYFNWLCGDHIVEQHVHDIDYMNWIKDTHPVKAQGMGGREVRTGKEYGQIFDHHYVEYEYPDGSIFNSQCRHIPGCWANWSDRVWGTEGYMESIPGTQRLTLMDRNGKELFKYDGSDDGSPHQLEQDAFIRKIINDEPINQAERGAISTMTAIMGRMATYTGQMITWEEAMNSQEKLAQNNITSWDVKPPVSPNADGTYPIPVPGKSQVI
jgi:myo-inositol 2-dehydrogenase/D-chiro-inositol 1-dehydrogenase